MSDIDATLRQNRSVFNPADLTAMKQEGEITPDMSIRDYFARLGVDVEGPVSQLVEMGKQQMQKANPLNKMQAVAGGPKPGAKPGMGQPAPMPQGGPPEAPGMQGLLKKF